MTTDTHDRWQYVVASPDDAATWLYATEEDARAGREELRKTSPDFVYAIFKRLPEPTA